MKQNLMHTTMPIKQMLFKAGLGLLLVGSVWAKDIPSDSTKAFRSWRDQYRVRASVGLTTSPAVTPSAKSLADVPPVTSDGDPVPRVSASPDANRLPQTPVNTLPSQPSVVVPESRFQIQLAAPTPSAVPESAVQTDAYFEGYSDALPAHSFTETVTQGQGLIGNTQNWVRIPTSGEQSMVRKAVAARDDARVRAFMDVIARGEVGDMGWDETSYNILHGFRRISRYTKMHPGILSNGSTAAGRYQFLRKTFNPLIHRYPSADISFNPEGQDLAVILLMMERGILQYLGEDDVVGAIRKAAPVWASLPYYEGWGNTSFYRGNGHNRNTMTMDQAINHYEDRKAFWAESGNIWQPVDVVAPVLVGLGIAAYMPERKSMNTTPQTLPSAVQTPNLTLPTNPTGTSPTQPSPAPTTRRWKVN